MPYQRMLQFDKIGEHIHRHNPFAVGQGHCAFDSVFQLAHIARPIVFKGGLLDQRAEAPNKCAITMPELLKEQIHEPWNVVRSVFKRRQLNPMALMR